MYDSSQELTALISSRICHDLASPLGAIANGLELLELTGLADTPEAALLSDSVQSASARIAYFRIAFGPANAATLISPAVAQNYGERKIHINWQATADCPRTMAKLLFLLVQSAETALPYGGDVALQDTDGVWTITCTAREVWLDPDLWGQLNADSTATSLQSSQVQFALAQLQAGAMNKTITHAHTEDTLTITVA